MELIQSNTLSQYKQDIISCLHSSRSQGPFNFFTSLNSLGKSDLTLYIDTLLQANDLLSQSLRKIHSKTETQDLTIKSLQFQLDLYKNLKSLLQKVLKDTDILTNKKSKAENKIAQLQKTIHNMQILQNNLEDKYITAKTELDMLKQQNQQPYNKNEKKLSIYLPPLNDSKALNFQRDDDSLTSTDSPINLSFTSSSFPSQQDQKEQTSNSSNFEILHDNQNNNNNYINNKNLSLSDTNNEKNNNDQCNQKDKNTFDLYVKQNQLIKLKSVTAFNFYRKNLKFKAMQALSKILQNE